MLADHHRASPSTTASSDSTSRAKSSIASRTPTSQSGSDPLKNVPAYISDLKCGLYSKRFKLDHCTSKSSPEAHHGWAETKPKSPVFPLPINWGAVILETKAEFSIPQDWIANKNVLMSRKTKFTKVSSNVYVERKRRHAKMYPICQCSPADNEPCGDDCINRIMYIECLSKYCPCGSACTNQRFQHRESTKSIEIFATQYSGLGLRAKHDISEGVFIGEYTGEVIKTTTAAARMDTDYRHSQHFYFLDIGDGEVIDAQIKGSQMRFLNHSCDPNCHVEKWVVDGEYAIGIFATRDIKAKEELTYNYNATSFANHAAQKCLCGAKNCSGYLGRSSSQSPSLHHPSKASAENKELDAGDAYNNTQVLSYFRGQDFFPGRVKLYKIGRRDAKIARAKRLFLVRNLSSTHTGPASSEPLDAVISKLRITLAISPQDTSAQDQEMIEEAM